MAPSNTKRNWGEHPWRIDFRPAPAVVRESVDFAVVGAGFTGLSTAAWLRRMAPEKSVAIFESQTIGDGSSSRSGAIVLAESAAGDLPGLGDVLGGFSGIAADLALDCEVRLPGAWEIGRKDALPDSPISWSDSGNLRAVKSVPGGTLDPGKLVSELARAAQGLGAKIHENTPIENVAFEEPLTLVAGGRKIRAQQILFATNAKALELNGLIDRAEPLFTLAVLTEPLTDQQLEVLGLASQKPFYTVDLPYLWGRLMSNNGVLFGGGLVQVAHWSELDAIDIAAEKPATLFSTLKNRIRGLHSALRHVRFTHEWGGPILVPAKWRPVFARHPESSRAIVLGGYAGHGVAQSVYLGKWAAEVMLGRRALPDWEFPPTGMKMFS